MSEPEPSTTRSPQEQRQWRVPRKMLVLTGAAILAGTLAFWFVSNIEDILGIGLDAIMFISVISTFVLMLLWIGWFLVFSRWNWLSRIAASVLLILLPVGFVKLFRPVTSGDTTIVRFEPIWAATPEVTANDVVVESTLVDLKTETPDDFPRFLGPNQTGVITSDITFDAARFAEAELLWKRPIGKGWSGFAARNGFAVTMEQREDQECVTCYDVGSGKLQWIYRHLVRHCDAMNLGRVGPRATPTISSGKVYAVGALGHLVCLDGADGSVVWQVDLTRILGIELAATTDSDGYTVQYESNSSLVWGRSGSPLIVGDSVVVPGGGPTDGRKWTLLAFDCLSGEPLWRGGDEMIAYGSPVLAHVAGIDQILLTAETNVMGFDPDTGQELWRFPRAGHSGRDANTSQVTVVSDDRVLTSKGYSDGGGQLIRLTQDADRIVPESVWQSPRALNTKLTSPVVCGGHAYSLSNGFLECARLTDGKRIWKQRGRFGHGQLLLIGEQLLVHSESGTLYLIEATAAGCKELNSFETIDGVCWNTLCLHGDRLLVRSELEAACFQLPVKP